MTNTTETDSLLLLRQVHVVLFRNHRDSMESREMWNGMYLRHAMRTRQSTGPRLLRFFLLA